MFPITVKYKRDLNPLKKIESKTVIQRIKEELNRLKVDKIESSGSGIQFKNSFFNKQGRNHLMAPVDKGYFLFDEKSDQLIYSFSMWRIFLISISMAVVFSIISLDLKLGVWIFSWLFGANWIIALIRHYFFLNRIKKMLEV